MALSRDPALLEVLQDVVANDALVFLSNEAELARRLLEGHAGVVVLDAQALEDTADLARRLHAQLPDLALIAAGTTLDEPALAPLVTSGSIHRFLHKPVSAQRVRLFIDAALRRHESAVSGSWPALPPAGIGTVRLPKALLPVVAAAVVALIGGVVWFSVRLGEPRPAPTLAAAIPARRAAATPRSHPLPVAAPLPVAPLRPAPDLPALQPALSLEPAAPPAPVATADDGSYPAISALLLKKTRFVDPVYPQAARGRDEHGGRVDLEYTVRADGSVADIRVTHAEPAGVYEAAATAAVRQWRYEPILRDGRPVDQRVFLELRFAYRDPVAGP